MDYEMKKGGVMGIIKASFVALACFFLLFIGAVPRDSHAACPSPAQIVGHVYSPISVQDAYDHASDSVIDGGLGLTEFTLRIAGEIFTEDLFIDKGSVVFDGGYDCSFAAKTSVPTSIFGTMIISAGAVNFAGDFAIVSTDQCSFDVDGDGFFVGSCAPGLVDCNDNDPNVNPAAPELCDGKDNDCNGLVDDGVPPVDNDGDGYAGSGTCGVVEDCNDNDAAINPAALDIPFDGLDQDCSGADLTFAQETYCNLCHSLATPGIMGGPQFWTENHAAITPPDGSCVACHNDAQPGMALPGHYYQTVLSAGNNMSAGATIVCSSCHDMSPAAGHPGGPLGTQTNFVWGKVEPTPVDVRASVTCDTCHENRAAVHETEVAHDNRIIIAECGNCHTSDTLTIGPSPTGTLVSAADVDILHRSDCAVCHNYTGGILDPAIVRQVIAQGQGGTPVNCTACHIDKASGHVDFVHPISVGVGDLSYPQGILCSGCHNASTWAEIEGSTHNVDTNGAGSCATCHNSTDPVVVNIIDQAPNPVHCLDCHVDKYLVEHGMVNHDLAGYVTVGTSYCVDCHDGADTVADTHNFDCFLCHSGVPALKAGLPTYDGVNPITCVDCHTLTWTGIHEPNPPSHNTLVQVGMTTCGNCHSDPPPLVDPVEPKVHDACLSCHDQFGGLISRAIDKTFVSGGDCATCHTETWEGIHPVAPQAHMDCTRCHDAATGSLIFGQ